MRLRAVLTAIVVGALIACAPAAGQAAGKHRKCTISGTPRHDVLRGTAHRDVICARGGDDVVRARGARDRVLGGGGDDTIEAQGGADSALGGGGSDVIAGGLGGDYIEGGPDGDYIEGGPGMDECDYGDFEDVLDTSCIIDYSVTRVSLVPEAVDTSASAQQVRVTGRVASRSTEPGRELVSVWAVETADPDEPLQSFLCDDVPPFSRSPGEPLELVAGTTADGIWSGAITVPKGSAPGEHRLSLLLIDRRYFGYDCTPVWAFGLARAHEPHSFSQVG
jgi:Ca2+-binding RTX toxin-like protein